MSAKGAEAERLVELWLRTEGWVVHRAARAGFVRLPGGRAFCRSHDLFGALDLLAIRRDPPAAELETWGLQVCTTGGRSNRRRRLEAVAWPRSWRVSLVEHVTVRRPENRSRVAHYLRFEDLVDGAWREPVPVALDMERIKAARS